MLGGLGYRRPYPAGWKDTAEMLTSDEARYLADADLYVISPQMCDVAAAAQSLTPGGPSAARPAPPERHQLVGTRTAPDVDRGEHVRHELLQVVGPGLV